MTISSNKTEPLVFVDTGAYYAFAFDRHFSQHGLTVLTPELLR